MPNLTIAEAALHLGITKEAMRTRVRRRQVESFKDADGQWRVVIPEDAPPDIGDIGHDTGVDTGKRERTYDADAVIAILRDQLAEKDRQIRELHVLLQTEKQMTQRLLSAGEVPEPVESPESNRDDKSPGEEAKTSQRVTEREIEPSPKRRSWLSRLFGVE